MSEKTPAQEPAPAGGDKQPGGRVLRGTSVSPGLVLGRVHIKDYELTHAPRQRVPLDQVEFELNRFHKSLFESKRQLEDLKTRLTGRVGNEDVRILDTHSALLKDGVFLSDVENLIINEQMALEAAIVKVIADFDRIFRLVQSETLRERAVDLRDVGIRVLRNLEQASSAMEASGGARAAREAAPSDADYVLVARELSIVDMFNLANEHVLGIITEAGSLTSHAAILARSMRIPTLTAVNGLLGQINEGDFVILDATEGSVRVDPDELVRAQYLASGVALRRDAPAPDAALRNLRQGAKTRDGQIVQLSASCGNLPEVDQARELGLGGVGLYRTELLYLVEREQPSLEALSAHYSSVLEQAGGEPVTFRLLHADSSLEVPYLHESRELNPGLGLAGVRILFKRESVLRRQLQAILRAAPHSASRVRIAVPFVTDCADLRRVKEILFEERYSLRKANQPFRDVIELGAVIETPVAALGARDLMREADFLVLSLDSLLQYLVAADRDNHELRSAFEPVHPFALRLIQQLAEIAEESARPLWVFGVTALSPVNLPLLLGAGLRHFCVAPVGAQEFLGTLGRVDLRAAKRNATLAARASCQADLHTLVDTYRHGLVRD